MKGFSTLPWMKHPFSSLYLTDIISVVPLWTSPLSRWCSLSLRAAITLPLLGPRGPRLAGSCLEAAFPCPHMPNIYPLKVNIILLWSTWNRPVVANLSTCLNNLTLETHLLLARLNMGRHFRRGGEGGYLLLGCVIFVTQYTLRELKDLDTLPLKTTGPWNGRKI